VKAKYFDLAVRAARHSEHPKYRVGAVVVRNGNILGVGFNSMKTHPRSHTHHQRIHAELKAILNAQEDVTGADIYVARLTKPNGLACAFPCPSCEALLIECGIRHVYATDQKGILCHHKTLA
jgi:deoxycytidylate deaminase